MGRDLATEAELVKLAWALDTELDAVAFARALDRGDIRRLRERVVAALYDEHRAVFRRVAAITRVLPTPLNVRIALRAFSPLLAARVACEMAPDQAAELANRMPIDYLAEGCLHLDPRRAQPLISRIKPDRVLAVVAALVERGEYIALGRLLDAATDRIVVADALAHQGRSLGAVAIGLVLALLISGVIEAFVTPSGLQTWARVGIGALAEVLFLAYVFILGGRAANAGQTGDVRAEYAGDALPVA